MVVAPGYLGSDPPHWQSVWQRAHPEWIRFDPPNWSRPDRDDWVSALGRAVAASPRPPVIVGHSLGTLTALAWAVAQPQTVRGLFLVAVPDPEGASLGAIAPSYRGLRLSAPTVPAFAVSSDDDPYCPTARTDELLGGWGIPHVSIGRAGHINVASGMGAWDEGARLLAAFEAGLSSFDADGRS